jgi:hypothetical protein
MYCREIGISFWRLMVWSHAFLINVCHFPSISKIEKKKWIGRNGRFLIGIIAVSEEKYFQWSNFEISHAFWSYNSNHILLNFTSKEKKKNSSMSVLTECQYCSFLFLQQQFEHYCDFRTLKKSRKCPCLEIFQN